MHHTKIKRDSRQTESKSLQHFGQRTFNSAHAQSVEKWLPGERVSRKQRAHARIGSINNSLREWMMVASDPMQAFSADENDFLFQAVSTSHRLSIKRHEKLVPNGIIASGRKPARDGRLGKNQIGVV